MDFKSSFLYLTPEGHYKDGFRVFTLGLYNKDGEKVDSMSVLSGAAHTQYDAFISPEADYARSGRCLPEGIYDLGPLEDAGEGQSWGEGIGRWWVSVDSQISGVNNRTAFGVHDDANRQYSKGSAGCICPFEKSQMNRIVGWFSQQSRPMFLICNLNVGWLDNRDIKYPTDTPQIKDISLGGFWQATKFIRDKEGLSLSAYADPATGGEPWTIGFGNTYYENGEPVRKGDVITESQAEAISNFWIRKTWDKLEESVKGWKFMSGGQRAALTSLSYNTGWSVGDGYHDTLDRAIEAMDWKAVADAFPLYINKGSSAEYGLRLRRDQEVKMWLS